jgi:hypothetical protein
VWSKDEVYGDGVGLVMMIKCSSFRKEERKNKKAQGKGITNRAILFW